MLADVLECLRIFAVLLANITPQLGLADEEFQQLSTADAAWGGDPPAVASLLAAQCNQGLQNWQKLQGRVSCFQALKLQAMLCGS